MTSKFREAGQNPPGWALAHPRFDISVPSFFGRFAGSFSFPLAFHPGDHEGFGRVGASAVQPCHVPSLVSLNHIHSLHRRSLSGFLGCPSLFAYQSYHRMKFLSITPFRCLTSKNEIPAENPAGFRKLVNGCKNKYTSRLLFHIVHSHA